MFFFSLDLANVVVYSATLCGCVIEMWFGGFCDKDEITNSTIELNYNQLN